MITHLLFTALIPLSYALMWWWEHRHPARAQPAMPRWARFGVAFFLVGSVVGTLTPALWHASGLTTPRLLNLSGWGAWSFPVGVLVLSGAHYAWHRAMHRWDVLWLGFHQLHHSPTRVDIPGAFYAHPTEVMAKTSINTVLSTVVLGLDPAVATAVGSVLTVLNLFSHWNIQTPWWLGWLVGRPEMHVLHHQRGVHARNYADVALWDLLGGTWSNPREQPQVAVGFEPGNATRLWDMLRFGDVNLETGAVVPSATSGAEMPGPVAQSRSA